MSPFSAFPSPIVPFFSSNFEPFSIAQSIVSTISSSSLLPPIVATFFILPSTLFTTKENLTVAVSFALTVISKPLIKSSFSIFVPLPLPFFKIILPSNVAFSFSNIAAKSESFIDVVPSTSPKFLTVIVYSILSPTFAGIFSLLGITSLFLTISCDLLLSNTGFFVGLSSSDGVFSAYAIFFIVLISLAFSVTLTLKLTSFDSPFFSPKSQRFQLTCVFSSSTIPNSSIETNSVPSGILSLMYNELRTFSSLLVILILYVISSPTLTAVFPVLVSAVFSILISLPFTSLALTTAVFTFSGVHSTICDSHGFSTTIFSSTCS